MSRLKFIVAILCAGVLGAVVAYLACQTTVDRLVTQNAALQEQWQRAQADRQAALDKVAANDMELENLRQDSMTLAVLREKLKTNGPSLDSPPGFYVGTNYSLYLSYSTPDPVLRSVLRAVMGGTGDSRSKGQVIFQKICAACHQQDAAGKEGLAPPLAGSEWVKAPSGERLVRIVLNGLNGPLQVQGKTWNLSMPPLRENLDDEQIAAVLNFIRSQWGGEGAAQIKPEVSAAARLQAHPQPQTSEEMLHVSVK